MNRRALSRPRRGEASPAAHPSLTRAATPAAAPREHRRDGPEREARPASSPSGETLAASARSFFEPRFGADLGHVRVHSGPAAARAASAFGARAFTVGANIYFGRDEYRPGSSGGRRLLAHELTHVFQQQSEERCIQRQTAPPQPLRYDRTPISPAGPAPRTFEAADKALLETIHAGNLTSGMIKGNSNEAEMIALLHALVVVAAPARWGSETDVLVPMPDPRDPPARVTVRIDPSGYAIAEMLSSGPVEAPAAARDEADATRQLQANYGITDVRKGDAGLGGHEWGPEDLNMVLGAFAVLPASDLPVLSGLVLERVARLPEPGRAAQYDPTGRPRKLMFADAVFNKVANIIGDKRRALPFAYVVIVHEVGHAIEDFALRDAAYKREDAKTAHDAVTERRDEAERLVEAEKPPKPRGRRTGSRGKKPPPTENEKRLAEIKGEVATAGVAVADAVQAEDRASAYTVLIAEADPPKTAAMGALADARLAGGATAAGQTLGAAFDAADKALADFERAARARASAAVAQVPMQEAAARVADAEAERGRLDPKNPAVAAFAAVAPAQRAWLDALKSVTERGSQSERLRAFEAFVKANNIAPFTSGGHRGPGEFYAEAYAFFVTDREYLRRYSPALVNWFVRNR